MSYLRSWHNKNVDIQYRYTVHTGTGPGGFILYILYCTCIYYARYVQGEPKDTINIRSNDSYDRFWSTDDNDRDFKKQTAWNRPSSTTNTMSLSATSGILIVKNCFNNWLDLSRLVVFEHANSPMPAPIWLRDRWKDARKKFRTFPYSKITPRTIVRSLVFSRTITVSVQIGFVFEYLISNHEFQNTNCTKTLLILEVIKNSWHKHIYM